MYCYGVVEMIYARVFETKLVCDYCDHNNGNKRNNNIVVADNKNTLEFDKTITKCNNNNGINNINKTNTNSNTNMMRSVKKLNEKMKLINHENSAYQLHLSNVLSRSKA